jgi:hypothetical protein
MQFHEPEFPWEAVSFSSDSFYGGMFLGGLPVDHVLSKLYVTQLLTVWEIEVFWDVTPCRWVTGSSRLAES